MKIFLTVAFLLFNCASLFAQSDIEQEIRNLPDTPSDVITKARRLLKTEFVNGNLLKVQVLKEYIMDSLHNDSVIGLSAQERTLLHYWTKDFSKILSESSIPIVKRFEGCIIEVPYPPAEPLFYILNDKTHKHSDTLFSFIESTSYSHEDKDFLKLHLHSILFETRRPAFFNDKGFRHRDELNHLADSFLVQYPASKYENYVRRNIRFVYRKSETAVAANFSIGVGVFNGQLANSFEAAFIGGISLEYNYSNVGFFGRAAFGDSWPKKDFFINDKFVKKDLKFGRILGEIGASYSVFENTLLKIAPSAGIGFADIFPLQNTINENPELKDANVGISFAYSLGLNTDFKLGSVLHDSFYYPLRFHYGYTVLDFKSPEMRGGMHTISLGIGMFMGDYERQY
jgi:hypothetical protein